MTLVLTNEDIASLEVPVIDIISAVESGLADVAEERAPLPPRRRMYLPPSEDGTAYWMNNIVGAAPSAGTAAVRVVSAFSKLVRDETGTRRTRPGDFSGLVLLYDISTAEPLAVLHDQFISARRVGATSAVGAKHLSRTESRVLGVLGSGRQAVEQVLALCAVRPIDEVRVFSPNPVNRQSCAALLDSQLSADVHAVATAEESVRGADVVCTATSSRTPVMEGGWLEPGAHLVTIVGSDNKTSGTEIGSDTVERMDRVVVNSREQIDVDGQPKLALAIERGALREEDINELHELVGGAVVGRKSPRERTLHDNNTGLGLQFAAVGRLMYEAAVAAGVGTVIDTDLLMTRAGSRFSPR